MVRIVGGQYRGKKLDVPAGNQVRPTTDRVRESLFNILDHRFERPCDGARVLDLFAGAGTLGLEAGSRGASHVTFVERDVAVLKTLTSNVKKISVPTQIMSKSVTAYLKGPVSTFDLVFMDPPYDKGLIAPALTSLTTRSWLSPQALVCLEYPRGVNPAMPDGLALVMSRTYGGTVVSILEAQ